MQTLYRSQERSIRYLDPHEFVEKRFAGRAKPSWRLAVICFTGLGGSQTLIKKLGAQPLRQRIVDGMDDPGDRPYVYEAVVGGRRIGLVSGCFWGGPQAAIVVEELACLGVDHIVGYGLAGSISRELPKCTQIVAATGLVTDGTSRAYTRDNAVAADAGILRELDVVRNTMKRDLVPATIATVDAPYQETEAAVREWASMGAQAINMETTPLYAASRSCGVKSVWLGYISDCLTSETWDGWFDLPRSLDEDMADTTAALIESLLSRLG